MSILLNGSFPASVAFGALGGPERRTDVVALATGYEQRNARWADSRRRYDASTGIRSLADLREVLALFERARGRLYGFRFRDPFDHASRSDGGAPGATDQRLGTGDGVTMRFPVLKTYGLGSDAYVRVIRLVEASSLKVALDGTEIAPGAGVSLDEETGEIVFSTAPSTGSVVSAGYRFDVPVRFDTDRLELSLTHFEAGDIPSIPLVELRI